jgi:hypothetical protein
LAAEEARARAAREEAALLAARVARVAEAEEAEAALQREVDFRQMLDDLKEPPLSSAAPWAVVRRRVWSDRRFVAVPASQREALFDEYIQVGAAVPVHNGQHMQYPYR